MAWRSCCSGLWAEGVEIETRLSLALPPVMADANQLELALLNLAVNARDAMPGGGKVVIASAAREMKPGNVAGLEARPLCLPLGHRPGRRHGRRNPGRMRSSPSSPPRAWAKAPGWASPWCTAWPSRWAASSSSPARRARAHAPRSGCRWRTAPDRRRRRRRRRRCPRPGRSTSWRWMTTRWSCSTPPPCWRSWAIPCSRRVRARTR